jgi:hypothetical protein
MFSSKSATADLDAVALRGTPTFVGVRLRVRIELKHVALRGSALLRSMLRYPFCLRAEHIISMRAEPTRGDGALPREARAFRSAISVGNGGGVKMPDLVYNENEREHVNFADTLGELQGGIVKGTFNRNSPNAYYMGIELLETYPTARGVGEVFLKKDAVGSGSGNSQRSKNRLIVKTDSTGKLIENEAWVWRHDNRILKLGAGFFKRAATMRAFVSK